MARSAQTQPEELLATLEAEELTLAARGEACQTTIRAARDELTRAEGDRRTAQIAAVRGNPDALGDVDACIAVAQLAIVEAQAEYDALLAAQHQVAREVREVYAAHVEHFTARAREASERYLAAFGEITRVAAAAERAWNDARVAWEAIREPAGHGAMPVLDFAGVRFEVTRLEEHAPYPRGVPARAASARGARR